MGPDLGTGWPPLAGTDLCGGTGLVVEVPGGNGLDGGGLPVWWPHLH